MELETVEVERRFVTSSVRMVGKIDYDETRVKHITAWVPGRLDRLYVDYTGIEVRKGDHLVYLYSPQLLAAQEELRKADFPVVLVFCGVDGAGKGERPMELPCITKTTRSVWISGHPT